MEAIWYFSIHHEQLDSFHSHSLSQGRASLSYSHTCVHAHMHVCKHSRELKLQYRVHKCCHTHSQTLAHTHIHTRTYSHTLTCAHTYMYTHSHAHTNMHTLSHAQTLTCTHTLSQACTHSVFDCLAAKTTSQLSPPTLSCEAKKVFSIELKWRDLHKATY